MIYQLEEKDLESFFSYLDDHLSENGLDAAPLFQPLPRNFSRLPREKKESFVNGLTVEVGNPGWRRAWIALDSDNDVMGHVDLRARPEPCSVHRALLGMGVRTDKRRTRLGTKLVEQAENWVRRSDIVEIIDLEVLSNNIPAVELYHKCGFQRLCEVDDMYRIDGQSEAHILMTKKLS